MDNFAQGAHQFYHGLQKVSSLLPQLETMSLRMLARADQLRAAAENLRACNENLIQAVERLSAISQEMRDQTA